ncbi:MAG: alpha/beta hydrolase [Acidobacteriota bacterium]
MRAVSFLLLVPIAAAGIATLIPHKPDILPPGRFVVVDGARLHLWCIGQGTPTVVLEPGLGRTSLSWSWLQPMLAKSTRVCSYDRPGLGWSEPLDTPRDGRNQARTLHKLLDAAGEHGPFVLVGHSLGGAYARLYRDQFRDEVQALVLLDSVQSGQCERLPGAVGIIRETTERLAVGRQTARIHLAGLLVPVPQSLYELPDPVHPAVETFLSSPVHLEAMQKEAEEWFETMSQLDRTRSIRKVPLLVLSSDVSGGPVRREWMPYWREMQKDLGMLSDQSEVKVVPGASHETMITNQAHARWVAEVLMDWLCAVSM